MKTSRIFFIGLVCAFGLVSCSEFLDEAPRTSITDGVAFQNEASLESQVFALYNEACLLYGNSNVVLYFQSCARNVCFRGNRRGTLNYDQIQDLTLYSKSSVNENIYRYCYVGINYCNTLLDGLPGSPVDEAYKKEIEGEAKFMRALNYFYAVRLWGNLPLITKHPTTTEETCVPRSNYNVIYKQILEDLEFAENNMRTKERQEEVNPGLSRAYRGAATFIKALVYMQIASYLKAEDSNPGFGEIPLGTKNTGLLKPDFTNCGITSAQQAWELCLAACKQVIDSGTYSLEPDYRHLFRWDSKNHPEDYQSPERVLAFAVTNQSWTTNSCYYSIPDYFIMSDGSYPTIHNGSQGMLHGQRWVWEEWCKKYGGEEIPRTISVKNKDYVSEKVTYHLWGNCPDPRIDQAYVHDSYFYFDLGNTNTVVEKSCYPATNFGTTYNSAGGLSTQDGGFWHKKCHSLTYTGNGSGDADVYAYRYAEVLLTAAEACANLGQYQDAVDYVNQVLARARKSVDAGEPESVEPKNWNVADYPDEPTLTKAIAWEREFEMVCEGGSHWMDQHRHGATWLGKWMADLNVFINKPEQGNHKEQCYYGQDVPTNPEYLRGSMFCAFPDYELRYNTSLDFDGDQNLYFFQ